MFEDFEGKLLYLPIDESFITATYGSYPGTNLFHSGIDINSKYKWKCLNKPVYSVDDNLKVVEIGANDTDRYGNYVILYDEERILYFVFAHLDKIFVQVGDVVDHKTVLGTCGRTGWNHVENTSHLHLEVRQTFNIRRCAIDFAPSLKLHKMYHRKED